MQVYTTEILKVTNNYFNMREEVFELDCHSS